MAPFFGWSQTFSSFSIFFSSFFCSFFFPLFLFYSHIYFWINFFISFLPSSVPTRTFFFYFFFYADFFYLFLSFSALFFFLKILINHSLESKLWDRRGPVPISMIIFLYNFELNNERLKGVFFSPSMILKTRYDETKSNYPSFWYLKICMSMIGKGMQWRTYG